VAAITATSADMMVITIIAVLRRAGGAAGAGIGVNTVGGGTARPGRSTRCGGAGAT
jgi:hypothetical protein